jgi:PAS domain S-box-containing protein
MQNRHIHKRSFSGGYGFIGRAARFAASVRECLRAGSADPKRLAPRIGEDSLRHMSSLLDSVSTAIISLDGKGRVRVFNAAAEKLFGLPRATVIGRSFPDIGRTLDQGTYACQPLWERLSDAVWAAGAVVELEHDLIQKNGRRRVISYSVYPLGRMAWSLGNGVVIMLDDITRKKEMEDQVSDARKRLLAVFDGITDGIQVVDPDFRITAVNKSMTNLLNRDIRIGGKCYESCIPDGRKCTDCPAEETFRTGLPASTMKRLTPSLSGSERYVEINTFPMLDRGNRVVQVVEYIKDVTEKMLLAERLEHSRRLAELGEMAARVAHEVRNPLNAITGAAHFLSTEYTQDDTLQKFTSLIKRQAIRVNQVASDLLYLSKPLRTRFSGVNVNAVLDQALDSLCEPARDNSISIISDRSSELPQLQGDELQLEQAFHNLLRNAIEAMPGGGTLRVSTARHGEDRIEVHIQDSGHGIPDHDRERVFQSFYTTKVKGTGLGLTIVQRVLKNHAGSIAIEQPAEGGTRVVLSLPLKGEQTPGFSTTRHEQGISSSPSSPPSDAAL